MPVLEYNPGRFDMVIASRRFIGLLWLALSVLSAPAWAGDYLPARLHDHATYVGQPLQVTQHAEVDRRRGDWRHFTAFAGWAPRWLSSPGDSERLYLLDDQRVRQLLTDFDRAVGFSSNITLGPCNHGEVIITAKDLVLDTPAGRFDQVVRLDLATSCVDAGVTSLWFAKGVGLVQWQETTLAGLQSYVLSEGLVDGVSYPRPSGLTVSGEFPGTEAWIDMMPVIGERPVASVRVSLQLSNHTDEVLTYHFGSSQRYDILLIDAAGQVVAQWSADKAFAQMAATLLLEPGQSIRFSDALELKTLSGEAVPAGDYRLIMQLTSHASDGIANSLVPAAQAPLRVRWAY